MYLWSHPRILDLRYLYGFSHALDQMHQWLGSRGLALSLVSATEPTLAQPFRYDLLLSWVISLRFCDLR
jgi:hypothetical protein